MIAEVDNEHEKYPYNLPMWSRYHRSVSPDGTLTATISGAEISMGNPTIGMLQLSNGFVVRDVNTAGCWSSDSRFFALPQWRFFYGLQLRQRLLVVDISRGLLFASRRLGWLLQIETFIGGILVVEAEPMARKRRRYIFHVPDDLSARFTQVS
jgi:hypothetical protein